MSDEMNFLGIIYDANWHGAGRKNISRIVGVSSTSTPCFRYGNETWFSKMSESHTRQRKSPIPISQPRYPSTQLYRRPDVGRCPGNRRMVITDLISAGAVGGRGSSGGLGGW